MKRYGINVPNRPHFNKRIYKSRGLYKAIKKDGISLLKKSSESPKKKKLVYVK